MNNKIKISKPPEQDISPDISKAIQLADQYLTKITMLQEELDNEEHILFALLQKYGAEIISDPELAV
jgi:RNA-binding protein YhbY